jgi:hypothetical protein
MKSPADLALRWARQWQNPDLREARLLDDTAWPVRLPIGRPSASEVTSHWNDTAACIRLWRELRIGTVHFGDTVYRATGAPVGIPVTWELTNADEWIAATHDRAVRVEYDHLCRILAGVDPNFHSALIRERSLWRDRTHEETHQASRLAMQLSPGCAGGNPLRALSLAGIDSKFFERHRSMVVRFLDLRFDGEASRQGLETFLDASRESDHWLLLADLGNPRTLPFPTLRVRATDLAEGGLAASALLVVENEKCLHLLPRNLPGVVAILGTGNNLAWLGSAWARNIPVAYWGDIDTWGLTLLARARGHAPQLVPILMTRETLDLHFHSAVPEKAPASETPPANLTADETSLYCHLLGSANGRLEQEFLPASLVHPAISTWSRQFAPG